MVEISTPDDPFYQVETFTADTTIGVGDYASLIGSAPFKTPPGMVRLINRLTSFQSSGANANLSVQTQDAGGNVIDQAIQAQAVATAVYATFPTTLAALNISNAWPLVVPAGGQYLVDSGVAAAGKTIRLTVFSWLVPVDSNGDGLTERGRLLLASAL